ncbi:hypothetical protein YC2023_039004 [Brassica napus]
MSRVKLLHKPKLRQIKRQTVKTNVNKTRGDEGKNSRACVEVGKFELGEEVERLIRMLQISELQIQTLVQISDM